MGDEWGKKLTPEQYRICRQCGTEPAFENAYWNCNVSGTYVCICCHTPLFSSEHKFNSGTGWPSFTKPLSTDIIQELKDHTHGMIRIEVRCLKCDSHLGHVFNDGPQPGGLRYCINSTSLNLEEA